MATDSEAHEGPSSLRRMFYLFKGFYDDLFMSQPKGKGPAGEVDTSSFIST